MKVTNPLKDWWLKFGCFLTGHNYLLVKNCSEVSAKEVKRYTSALLIVSILWAFIGFMFANRYLNAGLTGSIAGAIILVVIIIQVERQLILSLHPSKALYFSRGLIAVTMSLVGSIIIDQIILKEDIEQKKIETIDVKVNKQLPFKSQELKDQIAQLDSAITKKEQERSALQNDVMSHPTIQIITTTSSPITVTNSITDSNKVTKATQHVEHATGVTKGSIANPNIQLLAQLDNNIQLLRFQKNAKDSALLTLRPNLEKQLLARKGFLDELEVMYMLVSDSGIALFVWILWIVIILGIELFVLISKIGEKKNDYHLMVNHQMDLHTHKLKLLEPKDLIKGDKKSLT